MVDKQSQMDAGKSAPVQQGVQQGQQQPAQRRKPEATQAGGASESGGQMQGTQFTDWASI